MSKDKASASYLRADGTWDDTPSKFTKESVGIFSIRGSLTTPGAITFTPQTYTNLINLDLSKFSVTRKIGNEIAHVDGSTIVIDADGLYYLSYYIAVSMGSFSGNVGLKAITDCSYRGSSIVSTNAISTHVAADGYARVDISHLY